MNAPPTAWQKTELARHPQRPQSLDYIERIFTDFSEIHGDRSFGDDAAIICGMARFHGDEVLVVATQKGRDMKQRVFRNFGTPHPEGYRKAIRIMQIAEKFRRPIFTLVDTDGAYPGIHAEERGQAEAIAYNLREMARLEVPIIATVIGVGGSGGALGHRRRRPRPDDGELDLLRDFARRLRRHHVARCHQERTRRRGHAHHRHRSAANWAASTTSSPSPKAAPTATTKPPPICSMPACRNTTPN